MLALAATLLGAPSASAAPPTDELIVRIYDVGQGSCVLIECPGGPPILNDCGRKGGGGQPEAAMEDLKSRVADYRASTARPLTVVLSHPHQDHYSLLTTARYDFPISDIGQLYYAGDFALFRGAREWVRAVNRSLTGRDYRGACAPTGKVTCLRRNESGFPTPRLSCGAAAVDLLTAGANRFHRARGADRPKRQGTSPNGDSIILRLRYGGASIVLPGDAEDVTQAYAIDNAEAAGQPLARTSVLLLPHHGSSEIGSNSQAWVDATTPDVVVMSANLDGHYGHPRCEALRRFENAHYPGGGEMQRTALPITITCGLSETELIPEPLNHRFILTENEGHVTVTVRPDGEVRIRCQKASQACPDTP